MQLVKARIKNFRLLHNIEITFDIESTSIVGKNNSGKTSVSAIFNFFLNEKKISQFEFDDFSLDCHKRFKRSYKYFEGINDSNKKKRIKCIQRITPRIQLFLTCKFNKDDNWSTLKPFFINLDNKDEIVILCEYAPMNTEKFLSVIKDSLAGAGSEEDVIEKIKSHYMHCYEISYRPYSTTEQTERVAKTEINKLIKAEFINAQRVLDESNAESSRSKLSQIFQDQFEYEKDESKSEILLKAIEDVSGNLDESLRSFFAPFVKQFNAFGFPGVGQEQVELKSNLKPEVLFRENVKLFYNRDGNSLPEKYNGLGYSNLICIIARIMGFINKIKEEQNNLSIIFIEEPEAHMHPQMQSVFINNIAQFLKDMKLKSQVIITTHSSHILAMSKLESIRYLSQHGNRAQVKDLMKFNNSLTESETKNFLQQYLTLGRCDLFFADKAIFFEGTVERILLPIFLNKIDAESRVKFNCQYVSSVEVGGAYIHKFKELLEFLGLKTLIITDLDAVVKDTSEKTEVKIGESYISSNSTLKEWIPGKQKISDLLQEDLIKTDKSGLIRVAYQKKINSGEEPLKCGRSFEEAFVIDNKDYIYNNRKEILSIKFILKSMLSSDEVKLQSYSIQEFIDRNNKKTEFAFDLLNVKQTDWVVPVYIKEGLQWLAQ